MINSKLKIFIGILGISFGCYSKLIRALNLEGLKDNVEPKARIYFVIVDGIGRKSLYACFDGEVMRGPYYYDNTHQPKPTLAEIKRIAMREKFKLMIKCPKTILLLKKFYDSHHAIKQRNINQKIKLTPEYKLPKHYLWSSTELTYIISLRPDTGAPFIEISPFKIFADMYNGELRFSVDVTKKQLSKVYKISFKVGSVTFITKQIKGAEEIVQYKIRSSKCFSNCIYCRGFDGYSCHFELDITEQFLCAKCRPKIELDLPTNNLFFEKKYNDQVVFHLEDGYWRSHDKQFIMESNRPVDRASDPMLLCNVKTLIYINKDGRTEIIAQEFSFPIGLTLISVNMPDERFIVKYKGMLLVIKIPNMNAFQANESQELISCLSLKILQRIHIESKYHLH